MIRYFAFAFVLVQLVQMRTCTFPRLQLSPNVLTFAPRVVDPNGTPSANHSVTLTNTGTGALTISSIVASGDYSQTNNCPSSIAKSGTCTIQVTFTPNALGTINGAIDVHGNASGSVSLTGTGIPPVSFSPSTLDFGTVALGATSASQTVKLTNNQAGSLSVSKIVASGDYSQTNNCSASMSAGQSCSIVVKFRPTASGTIAGAVMVTTDASPGTQPVPLTGIGSGAGTPNLSFSPAALSFGDQEAGTTSGAQSVTVTNTSSSTSISISSVMSSGDYPETDTCANQTLSPGGSCSISVTFQPIASLAPVDYSEAITISDSDGTSPQVIAVSGRGVAPVTASPGSLDFGTVDFSASSNVQTVTLTNDHGADEDISIALGGRSFAMNNNTCPATLVAGNKCALDIQANSPGGQLFGAVTVTPASGGFLTPTVVSLSVCGRYVTFQPNSLNFGQVTPGTSSPPLSFTINNNSSATNFSSISITGANASDFAISNNSCGKTLASGSSCTVDITFSPASSGTKSAALSLVDDSACSPQQAALSGGSSAGPFNILISESGTGSGTVTSNPGGIDCPGTTCLASFSGGSNVTLSATPDVGSTFAGWTGGGCSGTGACSINLTSDVQVAASFTALPQLNVQMGGSGSGSVTSNPSGIDCPANACAAPFAVGAAVTLTASAGPGSTFAGWSGGGCSGTGTCAVTMNGDQSVTATFNGGAPDFSLSASALSPASIHPGASASSTVAVSGLNGFNSAVSFACSVSSAVELAPKCSISPSSAAPGNNATLTVTTSAPSFAKLGTGASLLFALCLPLLGMTAVFTRSKRSLVAMLLGTVVLSAMVLQVACGGGTKSQVPGTPPGNYTITITGTSGSTQHSVPVTLSVQ